MDAVELKFETTRRDWTAFYFKQLIDERDTRLPLLLWAFVPPVVFMALAFLIAFHLDSGVLRMVVEWIAFLTLPIYLSVTYAVVMKRVRGEVDRAIKAGRFVGPCEVVLSQEGVSVTRGNNNVFKNWKQITRATANDHYGFVYLTGYDVVIIPSRSFSDPKAFEMFVKSAILFHWHGENALKAAAAAPARNPASEPGEVKRMVIPMLASAKDS